eukprot:8059909-Lingulodinium_polyedra.AAC.1
MPGRKPARQSGYPCPMRPRMPPSWSRERPTPPQIRARPEAAGAGDGSALGMVCQRGARGGADEG